MVSLVKARDTGTRKTTAANVSHTLPRLKYFNNTKNYQNFSRGQSLINASVDRDFLFQVVTSPLFSTRAVFSLVLSYESTNSSIVPSYEGTNSSIGPSYEGTAGRFL